MESPVGEMKIELRAKREPQPDLKYCRCQDKAKQRQFAPNGWPLCKAGLAMPLKFTYIDRTTCLVEHERGKYICPLSATCQRCPIHHPQWKKGGCTAMMPISPGARVRYTLDRDSELYQQRYRELTAVERINAQAVALGIERPTSAMARPSPIATP